MLTSISNGDEQHVVILHGLGRTFRMMRPIEKFLQQKGYHTHNIGYPSTQHSIEYLSNTYLAQQFSSIGIQSFPKVHFVCHSLGGILLRYYLIKNKLANLSRIVMVAPPNHGSELAEKLKSRYLFQWLFGPAGQQLGTGKDSIPLQLPALQAEFGIIMGNRCYNPLYSLIMPKPSDGKVSVASAMLAGMRDFVVLPYGHAGIVKANATLTELDHFLQCGRFRH